MPRRPRARANGQGSDIRLADGTWRATFYHDGRRYAARGKSKTAARANAERRKQKLEDGQRQAAAPTTLAEAIGAHLQRIRESGTVAPRTYDGYGSAYEVSIKPHLGTVRLVDLTSRHLHELYFRRLAHLRPGSLAKVRTLIRAALRQAMLDGQLARNVADLVPIPTGTPFRPTLLRAEQAIAVLGALEHHRYGPFLTFILATGARFGEAAGLRWMHVDEQAAVATLDQALSRVPRAYRQELGRGWQLKEPKTPAGRRVLGLPPFAVAALGQQRQHIASSKESCRIPWGLGLAVSGCRDCDPFQHTPCAIHELVFPNTRGLPLREDHVLTSWKALLDDLKLPRCRLHDLRHSVATLARGAGASLLDIRDLLGHADIRMSSYYSSVTPEALRAMADRLERTLARRESVVGC